MWCGKCLDREEKLVDEELEDEKERERKKLSIKKYKYIGETSRSTYERALEHQLNCSSLNTNSYMLKHWMDIHEEEEMKDGDFRIKVLKYTQSSFERQILESVLLQENMSHNLLNSKSEYNRFAIPRIKTRRTPVQKMGGG